MAEQERRARLTKRFVDGLSAEVADVFWWDTEVRGFAVRVWPSGQRTFLVKFRNREGRIRRLTLGRFGVLTVDQARDMARQALGDVARGDDPAEARTTQRSAPNVADLCAAYQEAMRAGQVLGRKGEPKRPSTVYVDEGRIRRHILPLLGSRKANSVTLQDITRFRDAVAAGETADDVRTGPRGRAVVSGGRGTSTRTIGLLGAIFQYGLRQGFVDQNPVRGVEKHAYKKRSALLTAAQYRLLGQALDAIAETPRYNADALACARLIALTGLRLGEAQGLRWAEIDLDGKTLRLAVTKTGASVRPLGQAALALLQCQPRRGEFVFPAGKGAEGHTQAVPKFWRSTVLPVAADIAARDGVESLDGIGLHGLRHSLAGTAESLGLTVPTIAALLGHSLSGVTAGYVLKRLDAALIGAADRLSLTIDGMMRSNVVPLRRPA